jgi:pyruvate/2-oxoglutarate/acetoin dehydrogenase E1 component/TPP-dependent pyruvate/acetoin dehydrogenase alpha subunit
MDGIYKYKRRAYVCSRAVSLECSWQQAALLGGAMLNHDAVRPSEVVDVARELPSSAILLDIYVQMARIGAVDVAIRQGLASGRFAFNYWPMTGQEAIPACLKPLVTANDYLVTTYRGVHDHVAKGVPLRGLFAEAFGREDGINKGKGGPIHLSNPESGAIMTTGIVGAGAPIANGLAFAAKARGSDRIAIATFGDGATSIGAVHEAMNMAGALSLPVLFLLQNNLMGEYTPVAEYTATRQFVDRAIGYGIKGVRVDGNDIVDMYLGARDAIEHIRKGNGPVLLEAVTIRIGNHYGIIPQNHLSPSEFVTAKATAPIPRARKLLVQQGVVTDEALEKIDAAAKAEVDDAIAWALGRPLVPMEEATTDVYAGGVYTPDSRHPIAAQAVRPPGKSDRELTFGKAVLDAMDLAMATDKDVVLFGEDVGKPGGLYKTSEGLYAKYGAMRVVSTPIAETAIIGAGIGSALAGMRPICEIMFNDFLGVCMDQIANHAAKQRYMSGGKTNVPMTIRTMCGPSAAGGSGAQHTQSLEAWLLHIPGLKVVYPSTPLEAKGLLLSCIWDDDPCVIIENTKLVNGKKSPVPEGDYRIPIGVADIKRHGKDLSIITYGWQVQEALTAATMLEKEGIDIEVVDLRTLMPLDYATMLSSAAKTRRALVVTASVGFCGYSAELAATISADLHGQLLQPVRRMTGAYAPISCARHHEVAQMPNADSIRGAVLAMMTERRP